MKYLMITSILFYSIFVFGEKTPQTKSLTIDTKASKIEWLGQKKIPGKDHRGTVGIKKGNAEFDDKMNLTGGSIVIDMTTIENTDLSGKYKQKLLDHLKSDDFFDVTKNKEASFKITKVEKVEDNSYNVTGTLTVRGKSNEETFKIKVEKKSGFMLATGQLKFNRTKYGVNYNSESSALKKAVSIPKDKIIKDDIQLTLSLQTQKMKTENNKDKPSK